MWKDQASNDLLVGSAPAGVFSQRPWEQHDEASGGMEADCFRSRKEDVFGRTGQDEEDVGTRVVRRGGAVARGAAIDSAKRS